MDQRDQFFEELRRALGRPPDAAPPRPPPATALGDDAAQVRARADAVREVMAAEADELMLRLADSAKTAGWVVQTAASVDDATGLLDDLIRGIEPRLVVTTAHPILDRIGTADILAGMGVDVRSVPAAAADLGITGADFAIAETGTCVLLPRPGVGRQTSLLPPAHLAVVERGQVLPSLDELFTLLRERHGDDDLPGHVSLITGPSRTGDIEQILVTGVHGPGETYMLLVG